MLEVVVRDAELLPDELGQDELDVQHGVDLKIYRFLLRKTLYDVLYLLLTKLWLQVGKFEARSNQLCQLINQNFLYELMC